MSGGRVEVGLGAGWNELEHAQYGLPFPETGERFDMLEEQLAIVHGLWTEPDGWIYAGKHWQVRDALFMPKPVARAGRRHPNLIAGGHGGPRLARLVAKYADEVNITSATPARRGRLSAASATRAGRSAATRTVTLFGDDRRARRPRRGRSSRARCGSDAGLRRPGSDADEWLAERRQRWIMGTPDEARARVKEFEAAGVERLMLQTFLPRDLEMVRLLGEIFLA